MSLRRLKDQAAKTIFLGLKPDGDALAPIKGLQHGTALGLVEQQDFAVMPRELVGIGAGDELERSARFRVNGVNTVIRTNAAEQRVGQIAPVTTLRRPAQHAEQIAP